MGAKESSVKITLTLPVEVIKRKKWFLARCPALDVASQGPTEEDARKNLIEALHVFLESCIARGTLDDVLKECGFTPVTDDHMSPPESEETERVEVPLYLLSKFACEERCHPA